MCRKFESVYSGGFEWGSLHCKRGRVLTTCVYACVIINIMIEIGFNTPAVRSPLWPSFHRQRKWMIWSMICETGDQSETQKISVIICTDSVHYKIHHKNEIMWYILWYYVRYTNDIYDYHLVWTVFHEFKILKPRQSSCHFALISLFEILVTLFKFLWNLILMV